MENHPIPQDVTGFKFKLIGSMTVKQFLYLLGFGIIATIIFVLPGNFVFIRLPLMFLFAGTGCALAFLPIEGRPMDTMIVNFAKTIPAENRFIFRKRGANIASFEILKPPVVVALNTPAKQTAQAAQKTASDDKRAMLISRLRNSSFRPDESETRILNNVHTLFDSKGTNAPVPLPTATPVKIANPVVAPPPAPVITTMGDESVTVVKETDEELKQKRLDVIQQQADEEAKRIQTEAALKAQEEAMRQEEAKKQQVAQQDAQSQGQEIVHEEAKPEPAPVAAPEVANPGFTGGFPTLPDIGNVVLGIVRDPRNKTLPNILVEVIDSNNIPVRAFKTNAFGQFASATPLANGKYTVMFDDASKQHEFSKVEIDLTGEIFQPLEVTSIDAREKLRRELFGGAPAAAA